MGTYRRVPTQYHTSLITTPSRRPTLGACITAISIWVIRLQILPQTHAIRVVEGESDPLEGKVPSQEGGN